MSTQVSRALAEFFEEKTGTALRLVAHYNDESVEFVFLREDLEDHYTEADFERTFAIHRQEKETAVRQESAVDLGRHHCTLRVFDEAIVFNFAQSGGLGTVVSLSPEVGRDLISFITRCLQELDDHSPQDVSAPDWAL